MVFELFLSIPTLPLSSCIKLLWDRGLPGVWKLLSNCMEIHCFISENPKVYLQLG